MGLPYTNVFKVKTKINVSVSFDTINGTKSNGFPINNSDFLVLTETLTESVNITNK